MLEDKIKRYKQKYYRNAIIKGSIFSLTVVLSIFLLFNTLEYIGSFGKLVRALFFFSFISVLAVSFYYWIFDPLSKLANLKKQFSDQEAADRIGKHYPNIADKLLNALQISQSKEQSDLVRASLEQKNKKFNQVDFTQAIDYKSNNPYLKYLAIPIILILGAIVFNPKIFTESTPKIIQYQKEFIPQAPFSFQLINSNLKAFRDDDYSLNLQLTGSALPNDVYIETIDGRKLKMMPSKTNEGLFTYEFRKIQKGFGFHFAAAGFSSADYKVDVIQRPSLNNFNIQLEYPSYIKKGHETINNTGNITVPEGTDITWQFKAKQTEELSLVFADEKDSTETQAIKANQLLFEFKKKANISSAYNIKLKNKFSSNKDDIEYYLNVIPDKYPEINMRQYEDTVMYNYMILGGNIGDDYGITALALKYRIREEDEKKKPSLKKISIPFNKKAINQSFFHKLTIEELNLQQGQYMEYYVEVWDNDAVNGRKRSKTSMFKFSLPSKSEIKEELAKEAKEAETGLDKTLRKSDQLQKDLENIQNKLKGRKQLSWQDKQELEKLLKRKEDLTEDIKKLQEQYKMSNDRQQKFNMQNEEISKKAEQLQKLMDELLDEETKKLYDELEKLLDQNYINQSLQDNLKNIQQKQKNLKNELDRALELFKKLQVDQKTQQVASELEELSKEQEELAQETEKSEKESELNDAQEKQEELNKKFEDIQKEMDELNKMNEELKKPNDEIEGLDKQEQEIGKEQKNAQEQLKQKQKQKASQSQKKAAQKMQDMAKQMQQSMQSQQMQEMTENYEDLRQIMDNLLKLSFDQEGLMKDFKSVKRIDPKFIHLSQLQLKLKDDAKYIEDSLMSLSKRVFQIESFVTREVADMNKYMDESLEAIRKRIPEIASSKQQFTMTSINNLALLLNDILDQMQSQMSQNMSGEQMNQKQQGNPSLSELQKQLNQQIQDLKKSGKSGRQLSEELAKLAAEQEMIRNALKQQMGKGKKQMEGKKEGEEGEGEGGSNPYKKLLEEMEKTEEDLVNKQLTEQLIKRQKEIMTRLLESEKAEKERELDKERKGETAKKQQKSETPRNFDEYLKKKELQIELLRTIPTSLNQYYKQEVNKYFEKIKK